MARRFRAADKQLRVVYEARDPTSIVEIKWGAKPRRLAALVLEIEAHVRNRQRKRERETRRRGKR